MSRASWKYNRSRSYFYFWKSRWGGSMESLACQSQRPHSHPNQHTEAELKLIRDMRHPESLWRVMRKLGMITPKEKKKAYTPKPYQQMTYPGQRVQVDVKVVPRCCITDPELRLSNIPLLTSSPGFASWQLIQSNLPIPLLTS